LIEAGADVHICDDAPIRRASSLGYLQTVKALIAAGADVHACDDDALCQAVFFRHLRVAKALVEAGANISCELLVTAAWYDDSVLLAELRNLVDIAKRIRGGNQHE